MGALVKYQGVVAEIPGANIKEFLVTILSEANSGMVKNSFQRAKGDLGNSLSKPDPRPTKGATRTVLHEAPPVQRPKVARYIPLGITVEFY